MAVINKLIGSKAPNLPIGPVEYSQRFQDQYSNVLRLYFNEIDNALAAIFAGSAGGQYIKFPYGAFTQDGNTSLTAGISNTSTTPIPVVSTTGFASSGFLTIENEVIEYVGISPTSFGTTSVTRGVKGTTNTSHLAGTIACEAAAITPGTPQAIQLDAADYSNGVYAGSATANSLPSSRIYVAYDGIYNLQFSLQFLNYTNVDDNVTVWLKKNGTDIPLSASVEQVSPRHAGVPGASILALNIFLEMLAGQYVELYWFSVTGDTVLSTFPPITSPVIPAAPAVILSMTFVSALP